MLAVFVCGLSFCEGIVFFINNCNFKTYCYMRLSEHYCSCHFIFPKPRDYFLLYFIICICVSIDRISFWYIHIDCRLILQTHSDNVFILFFLYLLFLLLDCFGFNCLFISTCFIDFIVSSLLF